MSVRLDVDNQMPGRLLQTTAAGIVLAISLPVVTFAISTTLFALTLLSVRASILSLDFWISVLVEAFIEPRKTVPAERPPLSSRASTVEFRKSSFADANSLKRLSYRSDSNLSLAGTPINRDFEGVGGWRSSEQDEDHSLWMNMSSRLESTRSVRHHRRSQTTTALNSPELLAMPARTPRARPYTAGSVSPQSYFSIPLPSSRSMVSLQPKRLSTLSVEKWEHGRTERSESPEVDNDGD